MLDVNEFFKEVKDRLTSPLFASFIISWIFWNWKIVVSLLFDSEETIKLKHYTSYVHYINTHIDNYHGLILPFLSALTYILIYPLVKNLIFALITYHKTWGNNWNLKLSGTRKISAEKFLALKRKYDKQLEDLEKVYLDESDTQRKNTQLIEEKIHLQRELITNGDTLNNLQQAYDKWILAYNVNFLNGNWSTNFIFRDRTYSNFLDLQDEKGVPLASAFRITSGKIFRLDSNHFPSNEPIASISNFYRDVEKEEVSFMFFMMNEANFIGLDVIQKVHISKAKWRICIQ